MHASVAHPFRIAITESPHYEIYFRCARCTTANADRIPAAAPVAIPTYPWAAKLFSSNPAHFP
jgi:hypothetical protein